MRAGLLIAGAGLALLIALSWYTAGRLMTGRPMSVGDAPPELFAQTIRLEDGLGRTLAGWVVPPAQSARATAPGPFPPGRGVVVLLHGLHGNRRAMLVRAAWLAELGWTSLLIDLPAHGESEGQGLTLGDTESVAVRAAVEFARELAAGAPVGLIGVSLGGVSAVLAGDLGLDGLVLESVFPDIRSAITNRCTKRLGALGHLAAFALVIQIGPRLGVSIERLSPALALEALEQPVFVIGGERDDATPPEESRALFERAGGQKQLWIVPGAGHVDLYNASPEEYRRRVGGFLDRWLVRD